MVNGVMFGMNRVAVMPPPQRFSGSKKHTEATATPVKSPARPAHWPEASVLRGQVLPPPAKTAPLPAEEAWQRIPDELRKIIRPYVSEKKIPELKPLTTTNAEQMGILEESADILYECLVLTALQTGKLKEALIDRAQRFVETDPKASKLPYALEKVGTMMLADGRNQRDIKQLSQATGISPEDTSTILALTYLRLATLRMEGRFLQPEKETRHQLEGEFWELIERLPETQRELLGNSILNGGFGHMEKQFPIIQGRLLQVVQETLGKGVTPEMMFEYTLAKHHLRQGVRLHHLNNPEMNYDKRKSTIKGIEQLVEVSLLQEAFERTKILILS